MTRGRSSSRRRGAHPVELEVTEPIVENEDGPQFPVRDPNRKQKKRGQKRALSVETTAVDPEQRQPTSTMFSKRNQTVTVAEPEGDTARKKKRKAGPSTQRLQDEDGYNWASDEDDALEVSSSDTVFYKRRRRLQVYVALPKRPKISKHPMSTSKAIARSSSAAKPPAILPLLSTPINAARRPTPAVETEQTVAPTASAGSLPSTPTSANPTSSSSFKWDASTIIVQPSNHQSYMILCDQTKAVQSTVLAAIVEMEYGLIFDDAFPSGVALSNMLERALKMGASQSPVSALVLARMNAQSGYTQNLHALVRSRITVFRKRVKKFTNKQVSAEYAFEGLTAQQIASRVTEAKEAYNWIFQSTGSSVRAVNRKRPFQRSFGVSVLRKVLTSDIIRGAYSRVPFTLDTNNRARNNLRYEVPKALLALIYTAMYASLDEWASGAWIKRKFKKDIYIAVYRGCMQTLEAAEENKPAFFHPMMNTLWNDTQSSNHITVGPDYASLGIAPIDFSD